MYIAWLFIAVVIYSMRYKYTERAYVSSDFISTHRYFVIHYAMCRVCAIYIYCYAMYVYIAAYIIYYIA